MVRAYLLTKDEVYYKEGIKRLSEILSWKNSKYFAGDFNRSTILSMSTSAYDAWYNLLTPDEKKLLLRTIRENGKKFYHEYVNHLENRIADNHVWQMTFRILNMAAFATYGELPMASTGWIIVTMSGYPVCRASTRMEDGTMAILIFRSISAH